MKAEMGTENKWREENGTRGHSSVSSDEIAQAFEPAGSGDFPDTRFAAPRRGTGVSHEPANKNDVCATWKMRPLLPRHRANGAYAGARRPRQLNTAHSTRNKVRTEWI